MFARILGSLAATALVATAVLGGNATAHALETCSPIPASPSPTATAPAPSVPATGSLTGGKGGAFTDRTSVSFTSAGKTSQYHIWASHIDPSKPVKLQVHLHGDGGYEFKSPSYSINQSYLATAKKNNAILIIPKTPNADTTWWTNSVASDWLAGLVKDVYGKYNVDTSDVWFSGYSGGAQALTQHFIPKYHSLIDGGGLVLVGGGGVYTNNLGPAASSLSNSLEVRYVAGSLDTGGSGSNNNGFNAYKAAQDGSAKFRSAGFRNVTLDVVYGDTHNMIANNGPTTLAQYR